MTTTFTVPLLLSICGVEAEYDATVTGTFQRAQPAYTPRGEYAPTDPPEPAGFEVSRVTVDLSALHNGLDRSFDISRLLDAEQFRALEEQGIEEAGNDYEAGREAAAEARADARREDSLERRIYGEEW